ncbi:MAG: methyl-accepting chemotaxis protein [Tumebacillaceae bacterium]
MGFFKNKNARDALQIVTRAIDSGDFTARLDEKDPLADDINKILDYLSSVPKQQEEYKQQMKTSASGIREQLGEVYQSSEQFANVLDAFMDGAIAQSQKIDHGSATMKEISVGIQQITSSAQEVAASAQSSSELADQGSRTVGAAIEQMRTVTNTVQALNETVNSLGARSEQINDIVEVMSRIASQTNLLALNAAIEAARAGEHGKGFAVVADEVRKLAEQSEKSASQIRELIQAIHVDIANSVQSVHTFNNDVAQGLSTVQVAGQSFEHIQQAIGAVAGEIQEVSAAVEQISTSSEQVIEITSTMKLGQEDGNIKIKQMRDQFADVLPLLGDIVKRLERL